MEKKLLALVHLLVATEVSKIKLPDGPKGPRGIAGRNGNNFNLEDHEEELISFIKNNAKIELTDSQLEELKGESGRDGKDGKDGNSVYIEDVLPELKDLISKEMFSSREERKLKFSELTDEEKSEIRGMKGDKGERGLSFIFEDHEESITEIINSHMATIEDSLKLKFSDLSDEDKSELRGAKGEKGERGESFHLEDYKEEIGYSLALYVESIKDDIKLRFEDLTIEDKESLMLKFEDLNSDQVKMIRGKRGQIGKTGMSGEDGKDGNSWHVINSLEDVAPDNDLGLTVDGDVYFSQEGEWKYLSSLKGQNGLHGLDGLNGINGRDGKDGSTGVTGESAPTIQSIEVREHNWNKDEFYFIFTMSDGSTLESNSFDLPNRVIHNNHYSGGGSGSGSGSGGKVAKTEYLNDGILIGTFDKVNFIGPGIFSTQNGETLDVEILEPDCIEEIIVNGEVLTGPSVNLSDAFLVKTIGGQETIDIDPDNIMPNLKLWDNGAKIVEYVQNVNFIGEYVKVLPRVPIYMWDLLSDVEPSMADYLTDGIPYAADVYIDFPDFTIIPRAKCEVGAEVGDAVRINHEGIYIRAIADSMANSNFVGFVESKPTLSTCNIKVAGATKDIFVGLDILEEYYLSDTVLGGITSTPPTASGSIRLRVGTPGSETSMVWSKGERTII